MKSPRYARLVAEVFKRGEPRAAEPVSTGSNRDEEIALIEQAMDRKRRHGGRLRTTAQWTVAAALVLAGIGSWRALNDRTSRPPLETKSEGRNAGAAPVAIAIARGGGAIVAAPGSSTPAVAGRPLQAGSRLIVDPSAGATLSLSTGTHLEVEPGSQLMVVEDSQAQIFALSSGSLRANVAKLSQGERFIVRTVDAEVEVRGTSFLVDVVAPDLACGAGTTTRVTVDEGVVTVRANGQEETVAKGEHWPRGCRKTAALAPSAPTSAKRTTKVEAPPAAPAAPAYAARESSAAPPAYAARESSAAPPAYAARESSAAPPAIRASSTRRPPSSSLADENDLFAEGVLARRNGNLPLAVAKMDHFLERFPASHLAENAAAERMRMLRGLDAGRAAAAARQYLQRYPSGFARSDAEAILDGTR